MPRNFKTALPASNAETEALAVRLAHRKDFRRRPHKEFPQTFEGLFAEKHVVAPISGCWIWLGGINNMGYGYFPRGNVRLAHRVSWVIANGAIPPGMCVLHTCDVSLCVNPAHLELGSKRDNISDMVTRSRHRTGSGKPESKLTEDTVKALRAEYANGEIDFISLGRKYGVSSTAACKAFNRRTWRHVE